MAKKKKKKKPSGARKSTYAKGKRLEAEESRSLKRPAAGAGGKAPEKEAAGVQAAKEGRGGRPTRPEKAAAQAKGGKAAETAAPAQWNIVRRGTLEMKVFLALLAIIAVGALFQYPLAIQDATTTYNKLKKEYPAELKKFQEKYKTPAEQKAHAKDKPVAPKKPAFGDFLLYQALFLIIQGGLFAFLALNIQRRTDLRTPIFDKAFSGEATSSDVKDLVAWSVPFGLAALAPAVVSTLIGKSLGFIKGADFKKTPAWKFALSYINIAINNEILFTFLVVSALVFIFVKYHDNLHVEPHWTAIIAATLLHFGYIYWISSSAGEKPLTSAIGAAFLAISLVTILGYLYWRKGLEYSMLAGVIAFGLYPFIARLIIK
jgi:hypothetical protein